MNRELQSYIGNELETVIHAIGKAGGPHLIRDLLNNTFQETYPECVCSVEKRKRHSNKHSDAVSRSSTSDEVTGRIMNRLKVIEELLTQIKKQ
ncbi:hypothetical protein MAM1_0017c01574 [Mucor ambiguus]|uniref:Uncharacterized protein n=1 Tax=Mucor ambiguus TaxID=91626 RepID=A0A0C9MJU3_9FUNG|nr:hypothetical protein MAM1_0017c01574 [Mucor ambiguus]